MEFAMVLVDDARNAKAVETVLRDRGHTAFSVATVLDRIERSLGILTLVGIQWYAWLLRRMGRGVAWKDRAQAAG